MTQRSILITGSSPGGIGHDAALTLKARGWRVFASCRQQADCDHMVSLGFESPRIDHTEADSIRSGLAQVLDATGGTLDALFNNGAHAIPGAVEDLPAGALRAIFEANLFGLHDLTCRVIPVMRAQGYGRIVNHSSVLGMVTLRWRGAYNATKFALEGLTDTLRIELRDTPIHVITLNTGPVTSKIRVNSIPHFERWVAWESSARAEQYRAELLKRLYQPKAGRDAFELPPSAVSRKLVHALEARRPRPRYYITTPTHLMGAARRLLPTRALDWILARA